MKTRFLLTIQPEDGEKYRSLMFEIRGMAPVSEGMAVEVDEHVISQVAQVVFNPSTMILVARLRPVFVRTAQQMHEILEKLKAEGWRYDEKKRVA